MRKGLLGCATALWAGGAWAQEQEPPAYLPGPAPAVVPLLPLRPDADPPAADCGLTGGSTGLRPGVDCLPDPADVSRPRPRFYGGVQYLLTWFDDVRVRPMAVTAP